MKSVGLLTCYLDNCGACLQAYALQQTIIKLGYKCEIVKYTPPYGYRKKKSIKIRIYKNLITYSLLDFFRIIDLREISYLRDRKFDKFRKILIFGKNNYDSVESLYINQPEYDIFVCGSDQIWNPTFYDGNNKAYLLDFVPENKKRIAYAPSVGMGNFPDQYKNEFLDLVTKFNYLSVREKSTADMIQNSTGKECKFVLDPTLLIPKQEWKKFFKKPVIQEKYILLYLFGTEKLIDDFVKHIKSLSNDKIIAIPFQDREKNPQYIQLSDTSPDEFVSLINNASLVITDSFHATAFSLNLNTPFYTVLRDSENDSKSILEFTNQTNRLIKSVEDFPERIDYCMDFPTINSLIDEKRKHDIKWLENALKD